MLMIDEAKFSGGIKGGHGDICHPRQRLSLPPLSPQSEEKMAKISKFLDFCPLRIAFCPLDAPQKISGAAKGKIDLTLYNMVVFQLDTHGSM